MDTRLTKAGAPDKRPAQATALAEQLGPEGRTARARAGAAARWNAHRATVAALAEKLDGSELSRLISDWVATQPEWIDSAMMARPMILRGLLDAVERQQIDRFRRLGYV